MARRRGRQVLAEPLPASDALNERAERGTRRPRSKLVTDGGLDVPSYGRHYCRGSPGWSGGAEQLVGR
jgi:hypothetical protein